MNEKDRQRTKIVFLDRVAIRADLRRPRCDHEWFEYPTTAPEDIVARLEGATVAITNRARLGDEELSRLPNLRLIAVAATGYDSVDLEACRRYGITVCNVRNWSTTSVAEHAFSLMLALRRQLLIYRTLVKRGDWQKSLSYGLLNDPLPGDLYDRTLGIIGYGNLGRRIEALGTAFGMKTMIAERKDRSPRIGRVSFAEVLASSDVLCVTCPLSHETRGLIGTDEIATMRSSAVLINCARGGIVDDSALADALEHGRIAGAGVDVLAEEPPKHGNPLLALKLPNLIVTPHMAFASDYSLRSLAEQLISNVEAFIRGEPTNIVT